uniref:Uncharacterized protein n=1 Tax=Buteo japonicus TaxID=224669 RepID=A0A8B9YYQ2_9AVES
PSPPCHSTRGDPCSGGATRGSWRGGSHLDASAAALANGVGDGGAGRVNHGHQPHEAEVAGGEVDLVGVKPEPAGELVRGQVEVTETWWFYHPTPVSPCPCHVLHVPLHPPVPMSLCPHTLHI